MVYTNQQITLELPDGMAEEMKGMIPSSQSFTKSLIFNENAAIYNDWEGAENEDLNINHAKRRHGI
ncbi:MAG: hypothetical protein R2825_28695 [Saprospiraceae bacterium]